MRIYVYIYTYVCMYREREREIYVICICIRRLRRGHVGLSESFPGAHRAYQIAAALLLTIRLSYLTRIKPIGLQMFCYWPNDCLIRCVCPFHAIQCCRVSQLVSLYTQQCWSEQELVPTSMTHQMITTHIKCWVHMLTTLKTTLVIEKAVPFHRCIKLLSRKS